MTKPTDLNDRTDGSPPGPPRALPFPGRWRTVLAWTLVGVWGAWAAGRLTGVDRLAIVEFPAIPVLSVTPYAAATVAIPLLCAAVLRRPRALIAGVVVAAAFAAVVLPRAVGSGEPAATGPTLRVMTANLFFSRADPNHVVDLVRRGHVDVLSVQELNQNGIEALAAAGLAAELPHHVLDPRWGAAGTGLYARHPLRRSAPVPGTAMATPQAELTLPGGREVALTAVHPPPPTSRANIRAWRHDLGALPAATAAGPTRILIGDFNATLDHARLRGVLARGYADAADRAGEGLGLTWGVSKYGPPLTLDHILADKRAAVRRVDIYDLRGSDHRALFAELRLP
ncbi:MAG TPA: endonuclease/exonuclease/phosphatase family protein [Streptosporangiaceae bacterium]|jgi:endonuclease/exonuclease/phosphatase (EEP) superfamily protein YafD|nr:endonuclease/exonuclease/phosphatase family protein [Streptosporangiaceae bacterium]